jgi:predicted Rossmann fold nucleotide-binding protein DprA/Smf involved in DNA uptake
MNTQSKAVIALASRLGDSRRPSLSPTKWNRFLLNLRDADRELGDVFRPDFEPISIPGVDDAMAQQISELLDTAPAATVAASELGRFGIRITTIMDEGYPQPFRERLDALAPPVLYAIGDQSLLSGDGIGIVGSRNVTPEGKEASESVATEAVSHNRSVVSGAARGVDTLAMNAAFLAGGTVVGVLADSMQARVRKTEVLQAVDEGTICLISQRIPSAGFTPAAAMSRNKLVYALTETTVVIATDLESGGTWAGATEAMKKGYARVAVWTGVGAGPGNGRLIELGAHPVTTAAEVFQPFDETATSPTEQLTFG